MLFSLTNLFRNLFGSPKKSEPSSDSQKNHEKCIPHSEILSALNGKRLKGTDTCWHGIWEGTICVFDKDDEYIWGVQNEKGEVFKQFGTGGMQIALLLYKYNETQGLEIVE